MHGHAGRAAMGPPAREDPPLAAVVLAEDPVFHIDGFARVRGPLDGFPDAAPVFGMHRGLEARHVDGDVRRVPEEGAGPFRCPEEAGGVIQGPESRLGEVRRQAQALLGVAKTLDHVPPLEGAGEHPAEQAESRDVHVRPLALLVHGLKGDQVTEAFTGLDREEQGRPGLHPGQGPAVVVPLGREIRQPRHAEGPALHEDGLARHREERRQVDARRHTRDALAVGSQAHQDRLLVGTDRQQRAAVSPEERPDTIQRAFDGGLEQFRRSGEERRGRVGDQRLELETASELLLNGPLIVPRRHGEELYRRVTRRSTARRSLGRPGAFLEDDFSGSTP